MRLVVTLENSEKAEKFSMFLLERGIEHQVEAKAENQHVVWVFDEDNISKSKDCLEEFNKHPNWTPSPEAIRKKREKELQKEAEELLAQDPDQLSEESMSRNSLEEGSPPEQDEPQTLEKKTTQLFWETDTNGCLCLHTAFFMVFFYCPSKN